MKRTDIERILNPESIAVVGASDVFMKGASMFLGYLIESGYQGKIYPVNPKSNTAQGLKCYPSLKEIDGPVDHIIVGVPARFTPDVMEDAVVKGVNSAHIFTSGFAEIETAEGKALQQKLLETAKGKVRIIGPNCMGMANAKKKITFVRGLKLIPGNSCLISQSGGLASVFCEMVERERNYFSKVVSMGNSVDLKLTDFLEYFSEDEETHVICMYIEGLGTDEGRKFVDIIRDTTKRKPVLVLKAGQTQAGARAVASHTGAMASSYHLWKSMSRQFGMMLVDNLEEMQDFIKLHRIISPPKSLRACVIALGGGNSVTFTDMCVKGGIELPELQQKTQEALLQYIPPMGTIRKNPVDLSASAYQRNVMKNTLLIIGRDEGIDSLIFVFSISFLYKNADRLGVGFQKVVDNQVAGIKAVQDELQIPILCCVPLQSEKPADMERRQYLKDSLEENGIPAFDTVDRIILALRRFYDYNLFKNS